MNVQGLITPALGIAVPLYVESLELAPDYMQLRICIDFLGGVLLPHLGDAQNPSSLHPIHDTVECRWHRLHEFQYHSNITACLPIIKLPDGSVRNVQVSWACLESG